MHSDSERASARERLRVDPDIGMGNFLWKAIAAYGRESPRIIYAHGLETAWGARFERISWHELAELAQEYARRYAGLGIGRQDPVGIYTGDGSKYLLHFLALTRIGAIPVLVNPRMDSGRAKVHMRRVGVKGVFTDSVRRRALSSRTNSDSEMPGFSLVEDDFRDVPTGDAKPYTHDRNDPVLITHSSGTTGFPKAVLLQHAGFFFPIARSLDQPLDPSTGISLCALPPSHNSAISAAAMALVNGLEFVSLAEVDAAAALDAIRTYRPGSIVAFPKTYVDLLAMDPDPADLESIAMWFNLGDAAHESHIRRLVKYGHYAQTRVRRGGSRFVDGLGSSEMGVTLFSIVHSSVSRHYGRCVGKPQSWVDAQILSPDGTILPPGAPGLLGVRAPSVSTGYWNDSNLTYKSRLKGYFLTGDVAYRDAFGRFYHLDRATDTVMTARGPIHTLVYEEAIMNSVEAVLDCAVLAVSTQPGTAYLRCLAILGKGRAMSEVDLRNEIDAVLVSRSLQPLDELRVISAPELAVGVTGKVLKAQLRETLQRDIGRTREEARPFARAMNAEVM